MSYIVNAAPLHDRFSRSIPLAALDEHLRDGEIEDICHDLGHAWRDRQLPPGMFPYPLGTRFNLAQALAVAGGLDLVGAPQYAKICRQDASGRLLIVPVRVGGGNLANATRILLKPGDVIAVEQTPRTETRRILIEVIRISFGLHASHSF